MSAAQMAEVNVSSILKFVSQPFLCARSDREWEEIETEEIETEREATYVAKFLLFLIA